MRRGKNKEADIKDAASAVGTAEEEREGDSESVRRTTTESKDWVGR